MAFEPVSVWSRWIITCGPVFFIIALNDILIPAISIMIVQTQDWLYDIATEILLGISSEQ